MRKTSGLLAVGLGVGLAGGMLAGSVVSWPAIVLIGLGAALLYLSIGDVPHQPAEPGTPALAGLGERVETILQLAEEQAADTIRSAEEEAERIVAEARQFPG